MNQKPNLTKSYLGSLVRWALREPEWLVDHLSLGVCRQGWPRAPGAVQHSGCGLSQPRYAGSVGCVPDLEGAVRKKRISSISMFLTLITCWNDNIWMYWVKLYILALTSLVYFFFLNMGVQDNWKFHAWLKFYFYRTALCWSVVTVKVRTLAAPAQAELSRGLSQTCRHALPRAAFTGSSANLERVTVVSYYIISIKMVIYVHCRKFWAL